MARSYPGARRDLHTRPHQTPHGGHCADLAPRCEVGPETAGTPGPAGTLGRCRPVSSAVPHWPPPCSVPRPG
ncbi:MAG: hypothetical protein AVDCRST_MAG57-1033 [uncultured Blastococcus sp.]|uniref:Uncharacterized protein n=1 Tax=uncultured Blastococcus sp. TaxID=217144 RepID=A0A6J4HNQ9_9ACTN|nr:MAG: hypothetical protein AVDCRST_MAG57-1033 [uncultured Blastococcus sp.]